MPLIKPDVTSMLRAAGIERPAPNTNITIKEALNGNGLSIEDLTRTMSDILRDDETSSMMKHKIVETALKAHGAITGNDMPTINIVINDTEKVDINPILIPRQMTQ